MSCFGEPLMYHLVVNPTAGRGRARRRLPQVEAAFRERGLPLTVHTTRAPGHAARIAAGLPEDALVLSLGGDGTLHEVASACVHSRRTVGILPAGSGDDFAFALSLGRRTLDEALAVVFAGHVERVDTGAVNGRPFVNTLGVGFDAEVAHTVRAAPPFLRERAAYLWAISKTLPKLETPLLHAEVDGRTFYRGPALLASVQNGPRTGGSFLFAPLARPDDGLLELVVAGEVGRRAVPGLLGRVMRGRHTNHPEVHLTTGRHIVLMWEKPRVGHMEGELLEAETCFDVRVCPASLKVFAKRGGAT